QSVAAASADHPRDARSAGPAWADRHRDLPSALAGSAAGPCARSAAVAEAVARGLPCRAAAPGSADLRAVRSATAAGPDLRAPACPAAAPATPVRRAADWRRGGLAHRLAAAADLRRGRLA